MALINCPECGIEVSEKAEKCLKCAYPINSKAGSYSNTKNENNIVVESKEGCFLQTLNAGCLLIGILIGIIILISIISS